MTSPATSAAATRPPAKLRLGDRIFSNAALGAGTLILGNLAYNHWSSGIAGNFFSAFPVIWVVPIAAVAVLLIGVFLLIRAAIEINGL